VQQHTILIVDDDLDFAEALSSFLEANGYRVLHAPNGDEGVKLARAARPDLVLMDIMMGERTEGLFSVQELRRSPETAATPIFVISSLYSVEPMRVQPDASWMGHDEFFSKPVDVPRLLKQIHARLMPGLAIGGAPLSGATAP
jgi:CheY-like chemotaxis protein